MIIYNEDELSDDEFYDSIDDPTDDDTWQDEEAEWLELERAERTLLEEELGDWKL
jgi:hypothetical protein